MNLQKRDQKDRIRYKLLQIPKTRFKILYQDVQFDMNRFLQLIGITWANENGYIILNSEQGERIINSFQYDKKEVQIQQCIRTQEYLRQYRYPQLNQVYLLLQPEDKFSQIKQETFKYETFKYEECFEHIKELYVKINSLYSNEQELQALVDYFYQEKLPFYMGYVFYMIYDRLDLYSEYNGIIGRLLFLENSRYKYHFPISTFFKDVKCQYVNEIYKLFNVLQKSFTTFSILNSSQSSQSKQDILSSNSEDNEKYFLIKLNKKDIQKIILILAFSMLYRRHQFDDIEIKHQLLKYFQDPFETESYYDNINIKNFKEIRQMINELNWNKQDKQQQ